jgi:hypothetical protein
MPKIEAPIQPDWAGIIRQAGKDYNEGALTRKMIDEHPEDEALIRQKGGSAYADMLKADAERAEDRQWALDDRQAQRDFQREMLDAQTQRAMGLEATRHANAMKLAEFKAGLSGDFTNAQRNVGAMIEAGYTPQEAWAMYYGGNNPTLDMAMLGKKGQETLDKERGTDLAKKERLERNMSSIKQMTDELIDLADKATYTPAGQARDAFNRFFDRPATEGAKAREKYKQVVANELLPKLRETYGGQLSDAERESLLATLGDVNKSGAEKKQAVKAFWEAKQRQLQSYNQPSLADFQTPIDWSKASDDDLLKGL